MHRTFLYLLLLLSCFTCKGFSQNTTVSGRLTGIQDGKYIYLTAYPLNQGVYDQDYQNGQQMRFSHPYLHSIELRYY
jgi:hypothetical protein